MKLWILGTIVGLVVVGLCILFGFAVNACINEIEKSGLKKIVEDIWEGEE